MKKFLFATLACLLVVLSSCSDKKYEELNEKIQNGNAQTEFSQDEYKTMLEYVSANIDEALNLSKEGKDAEIEKKLPYFPNFFGMIMYANLRGELDAANGAEADKIYEKLEQAANEAAGQNSYIEEEATEIMEELPAETAAPDTLAE